MRNLKKVLSLVLAMAMSLSLAVTAGATFTDDSKISPEYATAVEFAAQTGILEGFENGSYGPQKTLTRAQLATMTYRIATGDVEDAYTADFAGGAAAAFTDTAADAWYAGYVGYAADAGYLKGVGEGLYKPNSAMTGYQALAAFLRVVGYNQPGQFTGADWTVQVAQVAYEIGALEDITGVDLNAAISREVAAQMIFNILFSDIVSYTPAFGYQNALFQDTLVEDVFGIEPVSYDEATAPWGQPATQWHYNDAERDVAVSIPFAPVATYTTAVAECDLADDLGLGADEGIVTDWYLNGAEEDIDNSIIKMEHKTDIANADQGTLTEVYEVGDAYWFVQIETFLGQIGETTDAKFDKNGHETKAATAALDVFCSDYNLDAVLETADYEEDDFVLVQYSFMEDEYYLTATAPVATATQTYINTVDEYSVIGETYDWAAHYEYGFYGKVDVEYEVFVDFYGNVIGIQEPAPADPVYTIWESAIAETGKYDPAVIGKVVNLTSGDLEDITVCADAKDWSCHEITYIHDIVSYEICDDGEYVMTQVGTEYVDEFSFVNDEPCFTVGETVYGANDETIFAVETACGEYDIYVGYEAIPTFSSSVAAEVEIFNEDADKWVDIVYVDASDAIFAGEEIFAYVMAGIEGTGAGILADEETLYDTYKYVVIDGETVEVKTTKTLDLRTYHDELVTLYTNDKGLIYKVEVISDEYVDSNVVEDVDDDEIALAGDVFHELAADVVIWVINDAENEASVGTIADIEAGVLVDYQLNDNDEIDFIIVWG